MKTLIYITIAIILCSACRSTKEKEQRRFHESFDLRDNGSYRTLYLWNNMDSSGRFWQYKSDTVFYFHPEEGLWASGGILHVQESNMLHHHGYVRLDSSAVKEQTIQRSWTERVRKVITGRWGWVILLISVVILRWRIGRRWHKNR